MFKKVMKQALPGLVVSALALNAMASAEQTIQNKLNEIVPNAPAAKIEKSVLDGLYQVTLGSNVIYMTADGKYLFNGNVVDLATRENLTESAQNKARLHTLNAIPEKSMIIYPAKGKTKHTISVFTDIDCPYCKKFHKDIAELNENGITVRYLAFPRSGPQTPSYYKMESVWCDKDPVKALDAAMNGTDPATKTCVNPLMDHMTQAQSFAISGTPTLLLDNGQMVPGYVPAKELIQALSR